MVILLIFFNHTVSIFVWGILTQVQHNNVASANITKWTSCNHTVVFNIFLHMHQLYYTFMARTQKLAQIILWTNIWWDLFQCHLLDMNMLFDVCGNHYHNCHTFCHCATYEWNSNKIKLLFSCRPPSTSSWICLKSTAL